MKYLVTGGHGRLGKYLCPLISCVAPSKKEMDVLNLGDLEKYIKRKDIDAVLHMAAICDREKAELKKELVYNVNVTGSANVAWIARKYSKKVIYISTERVFDCKSGNYREDDNPSPPDWYGFTKLAGEYEIRKTGNFLIIRTSFRPIKWEFPTAFTDVLTTADYIDVIAGEIALCLEKNSRGIVHIGTPAKSFFDLAWRRNPKVKPQESGSTYNLKRLDLCLDKWKRIKLK